LTTKEELKREGEEQRNCAGGYAGKARNGSIYIYRVLRPERATLEISLRADGFWRRSQAKAAENMPVSRQTKYEVDQWLSRFSLSV
jgi:hypothetical protein